MILTAQWKSIKHNLNPKGLWIQAPSGADFFNYLALFYNFKSCLRSLFRLFLETFFLNINLELILHNISCGVKEIPSFWCHEKSISNYGRGAN